MVNAFLVIYIHVYILYAFQCEILHQTITLEVVLGPNKIMNMKNQILFLFLLTIHPLFRNPSLCFSPQFPKNNSRNAIFVCISAIFCNFKAKWLPIFYSQAISIFPFLNFVCPYGLHQIHYHCLSQCKLNLTHGQDEIFKF